MKIIRIVVIRLRDAADKVTILTDLPSAVWPYAASNYLNFDAAKDTAEAYCATHFPGVPIEIIEGGR